MSATDWHCAYHVTLIDLHDCDRISLGWLVVYWQWACMSAADYHSINLLPNVEGLYGCGQLSSDCFVAYWWWASMSAASCPQADILHYSYWPLLVRPYFPRLTYCPLAICVQECVRHGRLTGDGEKEMNIARQWQWNQHLQAWISNRRQRKEKGYCHMVTTVATLAGMDPKQEIEKMMVKGSTISTQSLARDSHTCR